MKAALQQAQNMEESKEVGPSDAHVTDATKIEVDDDFDLDDI